MTPRSRQPRRGAPRHGSAPGLVLRPTTSSSSAVSLADLAEFLQERQASAGRGRVILDRRVGDRRVVTVSVRDDRRQNDRRHTASGAPRPSCRCWGSRSSAHGTSGDPGPRRAARRPRAPRGHRPARSEQPRPPVAAPAALRRARSQTGRVASPRGPPAPSQKPRLSCELPSCTHIGFGFHSSFSSVIRYQVPGRRGMLSPHRHLDFPVGDRVHPMSTSTNWSCGRPARRLTLNVPLRPVVQGRHRPVRSWVVGAALGGACAARPRRGKPGPRARSGRGPGRDPARDRRPRDRFATRRPGPTARGRSPRAFQGAGPAGRAVSLLDPHEGGQAERQIAGEPPSTSRARTRWTPRAERCSVPHVRFRTSGEITVRVQAGMEGVGFDQFLLGPARS